MVWKKAHGPNGTVAVAIRCHLGIDCNGRAAHDPVLEEQMKLPSHTTTSASINCGSLRLCYALADSIVRCLVPSSNGAEYRKGVAQWQELP